MYDSKQPQLWLQTLRDYLAGRSVEMDKVLDWIEEQKEEVDPAASFSGFPMLDSMPAGDSGAREISRQLWALLGSLIAGDSNVHDRFANCPRHNGFEAWRRVAEPINDDKIIILRELLPAVTNPSPAKSV